MNLLNNPLSKLIANPFKTFSFYLRNKKNNILNAPCDQLVSFKNYVMERTRDGIVGNIIEATRAHDRRSN